VSGPSLFRPLSAALLIGTLIWSAVLVHMHMQAQLTPLDRIESLLLDWRFRAVGKSPSPSDLIIVAIDEATVKEVGTYPLPRLVLAQLIQALGRNQPRALALDLLLLEPGPEEGDQALAEALGQTGAIIGAVAAFYEAPHVDSAPVGLEAVPSAAEITFPIDRMRAKAGVGIVNIAIDSAGTVRYMPLLVRAPTGLTPSFAVLAAAKALAQEPEFRPGIVRIGGLTTALDVGHFMPLRFLGPHGTIQTISARDVLNGHAGDQVAGKVALVGATVTGGDFFTTPFDRNFPGVEILATAIEALISGAGLTRNAATRSVDSAAALVLPIAALLLLFRLRLAIGLGLVALFAGVWIAITIIAFQYGLWLNMTLPVAVLLPPAAVYGIGRIIFDARMTKKLAASEAGFRLFHPRALAERLAKDPQFLSEPIEQVLAILFVDLSGFTQLSETIGLHLTRGLLKRFHECVAGVVAEKGGLVVTFMGDGAMVAFGLPEERSSDGFAAVQAALSLQQAVSALLADFSTAQPIALGVRIGAHLGPAIVSRLGHDDHQQISAAGDTVNVASRLMEVAKQYETSIALSSELFDNAVRAGMKLEHDIFSKEMSVYIRGRTRMLSVRLWTGSPPSPLG
jgi:adenylate cyclase